MFFVRPTLTRFTSFTSAFLIYALIILLGAPFSTAGTTTSKTSANSSGASQGEVSARREGELLVKFRGGVSQAERNNVMAAHGVRRKKQLRGDSSIEQLELLGGQDPQTVALQLLSAPQVELAEPNFLITKDQVIPSDPSFGEQWALRNTGQNGGQYGSDINITSAWQTTTGTASTVIAVIDSGIDFTHPDLKNNQWTNALPGPEGDLHGWDYVTDQGEIKDEQGHGTAVAGIIAAQGNNGSGISGVMWQASLMSLRVLDNTGTGDIAMAVEAIDYAVGHGAQVINLSWGTSGESLVLKDAIERAIRRGVVVVCSAGNGGRNLETTPYYPASFGLRNLITVAATDNFDQLASWSNWSGTDVTVAAPGTNILTTKMGGGYWSVSGTSAAAPFVAGLAGLIKSARPTHNNHTIVKAITDEARRIVSLNGKVLAGGVVNASSSLGSLNGSPNRPAPFPTPGYGSGGTGPGGTFSTTPPPRTTDAPAGLGNGGSHNNRPEPPQTRAPIQSNLVCADCDPQSGGGGSGYYPSGDPNFSTARRRPGNTTGQPGVNLGSRNFNWSLPLVNLPGRAGLDLNLTLSYNSLVWTKDGSYMKYNADLGSPAPGFRLGLPTLQQRFLNSQTGIYAYMLVMPSGARVELRQVGSSNIYESQDGSYTHLDVTNASAPLVRTSDGTQFSFVPVTINSEYRCTQIKDRNGNFISATYNTTNGHLLTITDTLGRVITFVYDATSNLQAISQTWNGSTHNWATFEYTQVYVSPIFGGGLLVNGPNNNNVTVLSRVNLHDGSYLTFDYNTAFGQVNQINRYAADTHRLSYTSYNVSGSAWQTECPRFTERRDWVENGVLDVSQEVLTSYSVASDGSWSQQTAPDGTISKEFFATTGWQTGLPTDSEIWSGGVKKKWTTVSWTQDDENLSYQKNPRVTDTSTYDEAGNRKRTTISYYPSTSFSLPSDVYEYAADATTVLRRKHTDYNLNTVFTDRRIIGLVFGEYIYDGSGALQSKLLYHRDWDGIWLVDQGAATQHDNTNYGTNLVAGRGNLVLVERYDVQYPDDQTRVINQKIGYNTNGSVIFTGDGSWHKTEVSYSDSFSQGGSRSTFAYPTTIKDADGFNSTVEYNYDYGAVTRTQDPKGAIQTMTYDSAARISQVAAQVTNGINHAYTRWEYPSVMNQVEQYTTIQDVTVEARTTKYLDGWGRVRASRSDNPGSTGSYTAAYIQYDAMGRVVWRSNPAEINAGWGFTGDDTAGWAWTNQTHDWKGRPLVTTNPDGSTTEATYGGCGCAGGEVTTIRDERGRRRKFTKDVLGRLKQVDELNWNQSVYSTTSYTYNARDQITNINQAGQTRTFSYDGYGRLSSKYTPEQGTSNYSYYADDEVQTITDARGATTNFSYNNRHLVTGITYGVPAGVAATPNVSFAYDNAGNRTSMTDGLGSAAYNYNTLSQLTSETRTFTGVGTYTLSYGYNAGGELTSLTNPWNGQVGYNYDKVGRPTSVSGSGYSGVSSFVSSIGYRAFGMKQMTNGNGRTLSLQYDNRMRMTRWDVPGVMGWEYNYSILAENSFRVSYARNLNDPTLDRSYDYDHLGRLEVAHSGTEARAHVGLGSWGVQDGPYSHHYGYDQWGNLNYRIGWGGTNPSYTWGFTNNRLNGMVYDASGNLTDAGGGWTFTYDATGQQASSAAYNVQQYYDGDRLRGKKTENGVATYYLRSTVLGGQVAAEINGSGALQRGYVYLGGEMIAVQQGGAVYWMHQDPVAKSKRVTDSAGAVVSTIELDPWGGETNRSSNEAFQPKKFTSYERDVNGSDEAMHRRYNRWWSRFEQPDPYNGSYNFTNPQSFNRYAYVNNDPVNFVDPSGLNAVSPGTSFGGGILWTVWYGHSGDWRWVAEWFEPYGSGQNPDVAGITTLVNDILSKPACVDFASRIINAVSTKDNPVLRGGDLQQLFKDFLGQKNGGYTRTKPAGSAGYGSPTGLIRKGDGKIFSRAGSSMSSAQQTTYDAGTTVAELFHMAGRNDYYTDRALAEAAHNIPEYAALYRDTVPQWNVFDPRYVHQAGAAKDPNHGGWSSYFHDIQRQVCGH